VFVLTTLWDAAAIVAGLDDKRYTYAELMFDLCVVPPHEISDTLPPQWNCLERYDPGTTKLLHYTLVPTQPWKSERNPLGGLWSAHYAEAVAAGCVPREEVEHGIARGHLRRDMLTCFDIPPLVTSTAPTSERIRSLELEVRAARGQALMAETRADALRAEIDALERELSRLRGRGRGSSATRSRIPFASRPARSNAWCGGLPDPATAGVRDRRTGRLGGRSPGHRDATRT